MIKSDLRVLSEADDINAEKTAEQILKTDSSAKAIKIPYSLLRLLKYNR